MSPQAIVFPRLRPGFHATQTRPHLVPIDSPATRDTIVHIVCNDAARACSLTEFFSSHSIGVSVFKTATEYIANAGSDEIACVILDLNLPDVSGLEVQSNLADREGPPVVFVTARGDLNSGVRAMKNGAIDFMIEPIDYNRLLTAVESAFARDRNNRRKRVELSSLLRRWNSLTPREQDVFQYTVAGFLNKQAAAELGITENTFQVHRGRVMRKMQADSLANLVRMATRLEFLSHSLRKNETSAQSLKVPLNTQPDETSRSSRASSEMRHSCTNMRATSASDRIEDLPYANDGTVSQPRRRFAYQAAH
jgi:FixJ family two-component response regulator